MTPTSAGGFLAYPRHFALLAAAASGVALAGRLGVALGASSAGWYGALHAATTVAAWRGSAGWPRKLGFVAAAGAWCAFAVWVSMASIRELGAWAPPPRSGASGGGGVVPWLAFTSTLGAVGYASLFRLLGKQFSATATVGLSCGCSAATVALLETGGYRLIGRAGFALSWWFAWSIGLWILDLRDDRRVR